MKNLCIINKQKVVGILNKIYIKRLDVFSLLSNYDTREQITTENLYEYNSEMTIASNGAVIKSPSRNSPIFFRIHGQICHLVLTEDTRILRSRQSNIFGSHAGKGTVRGQKTI
jgi:hypothetical protein